MSVNTWEGTPYPSVAAFEQGEWPGWVKLSPDTPAYRVGARWYVRCMVGSVIGRLSEGTHTVTEHEDGTITVEPSLVMSNGWHGWLRRGVFEMLEAGANPAAPRAPHPEETCRRCGGPNVSWSAPSPLWNAVMRGGSIDGLWEFDELICPTCFVVLAEERGVATGWTVDAETVNVELETVTPSGRRWDPARRLWVDPMVFLAPVPGEMVPERNADPWPKNLEGPDGLSLRFLETDGTELAIYINDAVREDRQVDVYRVDGTYRMDAQNG